MFSPVRPSANRTGPTPTSSRRAGLRPLRFNVLRAARALEERLREVPANVAVTSRLARQSGFLWSISRPGLLTIGRILTGGSQNPSLVYRIHARNTPNKPALISRGRTTTWAELDERIDRIAAGLSRRGLGRGQSIAVMLKNRSEAVELGAAAARVGAAAVSISWRSTAEELAFLVNHSGARALVLEPELLGVLEGARAALPADVLRNVFVVGSKPGGAAQGESSFTTAIATTPFDALVDEPRLAFAMAPSNDDAAAVVVYTSGTTGKPKGAVRRFPKETMRAAMRFINETPMRVDDVHLVSCPLYHATAVGFLALSHMLGCTTVIMDEFRPEAFLEMVERYQVTTTAVVPTMLQRILDLPEEVRRRYDTRSLRIVFCGGAPLPGPLAVDFMDAFGDVVFNFYGATETGLVTLARPEDLRTAPGTIGNIIPGNEIRLLDAEKRDADPDAVGELYVRSKMLVAGYHKDRAATDASIVDGFFSVGDLGRRDRYGRYFLEGRTHDMIISGGVNVYPAEVESVLEEHPGVIEVAVIGVSDREWGERVRAFVVPKPGVTLDDRIMREFARTRLAGPKIPRDFVFVDSLPRNPTGKVLKRELRTT